MGPNVAIAVGTSLLAIVIWLVLFVRMAAARHERRHAWVVMPLVGVMAAIGTLGSAVGFAQSSGTITVVVDEQVLTLVASMGRGALAMGGLIALIVYRPGPR